MTRSGLVAAERVETIEAPEQVPPDSQARQASQHPGSKCAAAGLSKIVDRARSWPQSRF